MAGSACSTSRRNVNSSGTVRCTSPGSAGPAATESPRIDQRAAATSPAPSGAAMAMRAETFRELWRVRRGALHVPRGPRARLARARRRATASSSDPAAEVLHEYEYGRNPRKSYFLERNRLVFVLSAYSAGCSSCSGRSSSRRSSGWPPSRSRRVGCETRSRAGPGSPGTRARSAAGAARRSGCGRSATGSWRRWLTPVFDPKMIPVPGLASRREPGRRALLVARQARTLTTISVVSSPGTDGRRARRNVVGSRTP